MMKDGMSPRKGMASDMGVGDFGVGKMDKGASTSPEKSRMMKDMDRACAPPVKHTVGKLHSQANPDHGKHM